MAKGKRRRATHAAKDSRRADSHVQRHDRQTDGTLNVKPSKYAEKRLRNARGDFAPTSPFYLSPEER